MNRKIDDICIKCEEPFTPEHPSAQGATEVLGTNPAVELTVGGGNWKVGLVHKDEGWCQETMMRKAVEARRT